MGLAEKVNGRETETGEGNGDGDERWRLGMEMETEEKDGDGHGGRQLNDNTNGAELRGRRGDGKHIAVLAHTVNFFKSKTVQRAACGNLK